MFNQRYMRANNLPAPKEWDDLKKPIYFGHVGFSAPSRSGTSHLTVETILQGEGWDKGWATLIEIGERIGKSPAQVALRWHIQRGNIVFPKSTTPSRIEENFALFDFELAPDDVAKIDTLDQGEAGRDGPNPSTFDYVPG